MSKNIKDNEESIKSKQKKEEKNSVGEKNKDLNLSISKSNESAKTDFENLNSDEKIFGENTSERKESADKEKSKLKKGKNFFNIIIIFIVFFVFLVAIALVCFKLFDVVSSYIDKEGKEKVELKYAETDKTTNNKNSEGIYITDVSEVVENVMPSIVAITSKTLISSGMFGPNYFGQEQYAKGAGSGIIVSKNDTDILILTNNHVIANASELSVQFINEKSYDAKVVGTSDKKDIAIISVSLKDIDTSTLEKIKIATMGDSNKLKVGNGIIAIGNALGYGQSVTTGVVSALNREVSIDDYNNKMIQIDAAINGGNSGGALLNGNGEVVGINSAKYSSSAYSSSASIEGMGFAIPISDVSELITSLMNGEGDNSATIGIEGYIVDENNALSYNMPSGFYISKIVSGSGADKSDLEIGNIITKINDEKIDDLSDIQDVLDDLKKGDKVKLTVSYVKSREYQDKEVEVTLS